LSFDPRPNISEKQQGICVQAETSANSSLVPIFVFITTGHPFPGDVNSRKKISVVHHNAGKGEMDRKNSNDDSRPLVQLTKCRNYFFTIHVFILITIPLMKATGGWQTSNWRLAVRKLATGGWQLAAGS
jgi:hypothetical protein